MTIRACCTSAGSSDEKLSRLYEDVYFMYRGLAWTLYESGVLIESGSHTDGFRNVPLLLALP